ncbi:poly(glycerol-phosphate) alpha-glucosyltransferase [Brevibacterium epidermidis]|uniref:Poly(Glycerol-phosphate) alpha-glucosyltransferase n=2 Tax=Brevibacterium epidermidis TaxID=1698 RepID=A0ABV4EIY4_BREEP
MTMASSAYERFKPDYQYLIRPTLSDRGGGGLQAMLRRSKALADYYQMPIDLLTYGFQPGMTQLEESLRDSGRLAPEIRIRNLWDSLSEFARGTAAELFPPAESKQPRAEPQGENTVTGVMNSGLQRIEHYRPGSTEIESVDYYREDGTRFVSDIKGKGSKGRRKVVLLNPDQVVVKSWRTLTDMFAWFLTQVFGRERAVIVVDSPVMANAVAKNGYIAPNAVLIKCFHSNHASAKNGVGFGILSPRHVESVERADVFDANVFPAEGLADAVGELIGDRDGFWTVGNIVEPASGDPNDEEHRRALGVVISRLVKEKNIDHAIEAVLIANENVPPQDAVEVAIFGSGADEERLQSIVEATEVGHQVKLSGYTTDVYGEFKRASFSILPTRQEAFGLSIVESMACGCIPIVYDVPYGPSMIITDGVDGFLVPYGDTEALAKRIETLRLMDEPEIRRMRDAARKRASDYAGERIAEEWAHVIDVAWSQKRNRPSAGLDSREIELTDALVRNDSQGSRIDVEFSCESKVRREAEENTRAFMSFRGRDSTLRLRVPGMVRTKRTGLLRRKSVVAASFRVPSKLLDRAPREVIDIFVRINDSARVREYRLPAGDIQVSEFELPQGLEAYVTKPGNLSFRESAQ